MTTQAHLPCDLFPRIQSNVSDDMENHQLQYGLMNPMQFNHGKVKDFTVASNLQSELIGKGSGSKKRGREESFLMDLTTTPVCFGGYDSNVIGSAEDTLVSTDQLRVIDSIGTSTSNQISCASTSSPTALDLLAAQLYNQSLEIDALIRLQNERLRLGLEQSQKRHCKALISFIEQQFLNKMKEKDAKLENALQKNAELEEKVRQLCVENQIWYNFAKNNEAIVAYLKASLEQVLLENATACDNANQAKEGYGDNNGTTFPADDAQSCCFLQEVEDRRVCKACHKKEVGVLLLPCRHLCLCMACDPKINTCPVCHDDKQASLEIFMT